MIAGVSEEIQRLSFTIKQCVEGSNPHKLDVKGMSQQLKHLVAYSKLFQKTLAKGQVWTNNLKGNTFTIVFVDDLSVLYDMEGPGTMTHRKHAVREYFEQHYARQFVR